MKIKDVIEKIEKYAPLSFSREAIERGSHDNSGFLVGDKEREFRKALICIDVGERAISEALEFGCNLLISHHPFIYYPISNVLEENPKGRNLMKILENKLNVYSAHLSMDFTKGGVDDEVANFLGINTDGVFEKFCGGGYGKVGNVEEMRFDAYVDFVKKTFKSVRVIGENKQIKRVASFCGGGLGFEELVFAKTSKADVVVSCDVPHHLIQECVEMGLNLIELSHGESEFCAFKKIFEDNFKDIEKVYCDNEYRLEDK